MCSHRGHRTPALQYPKRSDTRRRPRLGLAVACLAALATSCAVARGEGLSLLEAQRVALVHNADLRIAEAAVDAALAQVRAAREFPNPTLGFSTASINTDGRGNGSPLHNEFLQRSYDSIVSLSQLLEIAGKRGLRQDSARAGQKATEAQRDDVRRLLLQSVAQAYIAALVAQEDVRVLEDSAASLRREAEVAAIRLKAGDISASDKAQIEIAADRFGLDAATARHAAAAATIALEALLGQSNPGGQTELSDTLGTLAVPASAALLDAGIAVERPDIASAEANVEKADADWRLQRRERIPDLTVSAQFEHHPPDQPNSVGFGLSLPLPLWNRNGGAIHAARAARDQAQAELDQARIQATADLAVARSAVRDAESRAAAYRDRLQPKSADVLHTVMFAYEKGGASLLDLLSAQRNDNDIRQAAAHAEADAASARIALAAALNRLRPPDPS